MDDNCSHVCVHQSSNVANKGCQFWVNDHTGLGYMTDVTGVNECTHPIVQITIIQALHVPA